MTQSRRMLVLRAVVDDGEAKITEYGLDHPQMNISAFDAGGAEVAQLKVATVPLAPPRIKRIGRSRNSLASRFSYQCV